MAIRCITGTRFTMNAEVLRWNAITEGTEEDVTEGHWESYQDPITGEIRNDWIPGTPDNPSIPGDQSTVLRTIDCLARGIVDGGIRVAGSTERFGDEYTNVEYVKLWTPARTRITKRDRITNIRAKRGGDVVWTDEDGAPVVFNVNGVTPLFDAFNRHVENYVMLERAE